MRGWVALLVMHAMLAGCSDAASNDDLFPQAYLLDGLDLPTEFELLTESSPDWEATVARLGMHENPGYADSARFEQVLPGAPAPQEVYASVYLGKHAEGNTLVTALAVQMGDAGDARAALALQDCEHARGTLLVLHDGDRLVFLISYGPFDVATELDEVAKRIQTETGAMVACQTT